jgi:hypothetical protein
MPAPLKLFYSYSPRDEALRGGLDAHLGLLKHQGHIEDWHQGLIGAGAERDAAIGDHLAKADVILLLVSATFIAASYGEEIARAIARHDAGEAVVIPVALRPCDWKDAPFEKLQALPKNRRPVTKWKDRDEAWADVAAGIRRAVEALKERPTRAAEANANPR